MKLNTKEGIELGRKALKEFGDWSKVRAAGDKQEDGVIVVRRKKETSKSVDAPTEKK